jgi:predicted ATPase
MFRRRLIPWLAMLTRIRIDGFKNLRGLDVELGPFTCIAGPNGVGKSNLFDAINLLSLLADHPLMEAARAVRRTEGGSADPKDLFWTDGRNRSREIQICAEMVVPSHVRDDFGRSSGAATTFLRYEIHLGYEPPSGVDNLGRLVLEKEDLDYIKKGEAAQHLRFPHNKREFRDAIVLGRRFGKKYISTHDEGGERTIRVHQDGGGGQSRPAPARSASRTVVSTTTTSSDPTILAARREMQSWRLMALEPSAMRGADPYLASPRLGADGAHMAATLYRLARRPLKPDMPPDPEAVYDSLAARAGTLVDVRGIRVVRDEQRELLTLELREGRGDFMPARSASDGTLRFLALCILDADPEVTGVICMEEPENGIHPARMQAMVDLVQGLAVDPELPPGDDNPLRQVIVNTHSPLFVALVDARHRDDLLLATETTIRGPAGEPVKTMRLRPVSDTWRCSDQEPGVSIQEFDTYLVDQRGQLGLGLPPASHQSR